MAALSISRCTWVVATVKSDSQVKEAPAYWPASIVPTLAVLLVVW